MCILAPLYFPVGSEFPGENLGRFDDLKKTLERLTFRTSLRLAFGSDNTYTYSVRDLRSDTERYMRVAPMALRSPSQNHFVLESRGGEEAGGTYRMATICTKWHA
jgi:hypothetical protein